MSFSLLLWQKAIVICMVIWIYNAGLRLGPVEGLLFPEFIPWNLEVEVRNKHTDPFIAQVTINKGANHILKIGYWSLHVKNWTIPCSLNPERALLLAIDLFPYHCMFLVKIIQVVHNIQINHLTCTPVADWCTCLRKMWSINCSGISG